MIITDNSHKISRTQNRSQSDKKKLSDLQVEEEELFDTFLSSAKVSNLFLQIKTFVLILIVLEKEKRNINITILKHRNNK